jgi:hypothetical protein
MQFPEAIIQGSKLVAYPHHNKHHILGIDSWGANGETGRYGRLFVFITREEVIISVDSNEEHCY